VIKRYQIQPSLARSKRIAQNKENINMAFTPKFTPAETGTQDVSVTVKKNGKEITKTAKATLYASAEDLLVKEFHGSMEELLDSFNSLADKAAKAVARQSCYVVLAGPSKALYAFARKLYRDSTKFGSEITPQKAFDLAVASFAHIPEVSDVEYNESKVVGDEEEEPEEVETT
jgi:hypothetical protein